MKQIISFSLWENSTSKKSYIKGAFENIKLAKEFYPNWTCRFYIHKDLENLKNKFTKEGAEVIIVNENPVISNDNKPGMFWRFRVINDSSIDRFIIRDSDSRIYQRDKNCVLDWIKSKKPFHIIRDHQHHGTKIMGGMWGATKEIRNILNYNKLLKEYLQNNHKIVYGVDQDFLALYIYPKVKDIALIHDDWDRYNEGAKKIPHIKSDNNFIGKSYK